LTPEILCEDGPVLAINKPVGLLTQGGPRGNPPTAIGLVKDWLKKKYQKPGNVYLGVLHRLDRPVSGVLLFARNSKAAARLSEQFREQSIKKIYWAIVEGVPKPSGEWTDWLLKQSDPVRVRVVPEGTKNAKQAVLKYRTIATLESGTLVEVELLTGRSHQIRVQFSSRGFPIVGDIKYGAQTRLPGAQPRHQDDVSLALHARSLTIEHPIRKEPLEITAKLPATWRQLGAAVAPHCI
jgi:23S rRNA pseudouridine1911/1915/1917 synthase